LHFPSVKSGSGILCADVAAKTENAREAPAERLPKGATRLADAILPPSDEQVRRIKWLKEFLAGLERKAGLNGAEHVSGSGSRGQGGARAKVKMPP
jgi:hypothetical protein